MITIEQAKKKLEEMCISPAMQLRDDPMQVLMSVLDRKITLTPQFLDDDPKGRELVLFLEKRLAADHLGYLEKHQVNGIWGGSTTKAVKKLCENYHIAFDDKKVVIGATILSAILDGSKPAKSIEDDLLAHQTASYDWFKALYKSKGYNFIEIEGHVNIAGIRGFLDGRENNNEPNRYNDTVFLIRKEKGVKIVEAYRASVDPGRYYYAVNPINVNGCAHVEPGFWTFQRGHHVTSRSNYAALIQKDPILVKRSNNGNPPKDAPKERGIFWTNIHAGSESEWVEAASAGCQVIYSNGPNGWQWKKFVNQCYKSANQTFGYALFDSKTDF